MCALLKFETGEDVVECEVFENEAYTLFSGWQPAPALPNAKKHGFTSSPAERLLWAE